MTELSSLLIEAVSSAFLSADAIAASSADERRAATFRLALRAHPEASLQLRDAPVAALQETLAKVIETISAAKRKHHQKCDADPAAAFGIFLAAERREDSPSSASAAKLTNESDANEVEKVCAALILAAIRRRQQEANNQQLNQQSAHVVFPQPQIIHEVQHPARAHHHHPELLQDASPISSVSTASPPSAPAAAAAAAAAAVAATPAGMMIHSSKVQQSQQQQQQQQHHPQKHEYHNSLDLGASFPSPISDSTVGGAGAGWATNEREEQQQEEVENTQDQYEVAARTPPRGGETFTAAAAAAGDPSSLSRTPLSPFPSVLELSAVAQREQCEEDEKDNDYVQGGAAVQQLVFHEQPHEHPPPQQQQPTSSSPSFATRRWKHQDPQHPVGAASTSSTARVTIFGDQDQARAGGTTIAPTVSASGDFLVSAMPSISIVGQEMVTLPQQTNGAEEKDNDQKWQSAASLSPHRRRAESKKEKDDSGKNDDALNQSLEDAMKDIATDVAVRRQQGDVSRNRRSWVHRPAPTPPAFAAAAAAAAGNESTEEKKREEDDEESSSPPPVVASPHKEEEPSPQPEEDREKQPQFENKNGNDEPEKEVLPHQTAASSSPVGRRAASANIEESAEQEHRRQALLRGCLLFWWQRTATERCIHHFQLQQSFSKWKRRAELESLLRSWENPALRNQQLRLQHHYHHHDKSNHSSVGLNSSGGSGDGDASSLSQMMLNMQQHRTPREKTLLVTAFRTWKRFFQARLVTAQRSVRTTAEALALWRRRTAEAPLVKALVALRAFHLASGAFTAWSARWRLRAGERLVEGQTRGALLLRHAWRKWYRRHRQESAVRAFTSYNNNSSSFYNNISNNNTNMTTNDSSLIPAVVAERQESALSWKLMLKRRCMEKWMTRQHHREAERYVHQLRSRTLQKQALEWWRCRAQERANKRMRDAAHFKAVDCPAILTKVAFLRWKRKAASARFARERDTAVTRVLFKEWTRKALLSRHARMVMASRRMRDQSSQFSFGRAMLRM